MQQTDAISYRQPSHPGTVVTRNGTQIDLSGSEWLIPMPNMTGRIVFYQDPSAALSPELREYGYSRLSTKSTSVSHFTLWIWTEHFRKHLTEHAITELDWGGLSIDLLEGYREELRGKGVEYYFWHIQDVLSWMHINHPELLDEALVLEVLTWRIKGNRKGEAIELADPYRGALTIAESDAIRAAALDPACPATMLERAVTLMFLETGQRNEQLSQLLTGDLKSIRYKTEGDPRHYDPDNAVRCMVAMPSNKTARGRRELSISRELFNLCLRLAKETAHLRKQLLDSPLFIIDPERQAIEPAWFDADTTRWSRVRVPNSWDLNALVHSFCEKCDIRDRFGEPIHIFARRFRRTVATRMVEQGASPEHVAVLLDHADVQQVMVYFEFNEARKQQRMEEAAGPFFRALGESMAGLLIANATKARNPEAVIPFFDEESQDLLGIANCGRDMERAPLCHESIPYACYGCPHHQPWISEVHEKVLTSLEKRKARLVEEQGTIRGRLPAGIDSLINHVRSVVEAVRQVKQAEEKGS